MGRPWGTQFAAAYRHTSLLLLNAGVVFIAINLLLMAFFLFRAAAGEPVTERYGDDVVHEAHRRASRAETDEILRETWSRALAYEPFTEFKERPFTGKHVNVHTAGFRLSAQQGPWPPSEAFTNVFVFGGSTTFGYSLADSETVVSAMQAAFTRRLGRPVRAYNFGRGFYYSTQERILFERLLSEGFKPDVAIFIDGLNDFTVPDDEPFLSAEQRSFFDGYPGELRYVQKLPMARLARGIRNRWNTWRQPDVTSPESEALFPLRYDDRALLGTVIERFLKNKKITEAVAAAFDVTPIFVWQPVPTYEFDFRDYPFIGRGFGVHAYSRFGYRLMAERVAEGRLGANFLWCADIHAQLTMPPYVDQVHYSAYFSNLLGERIVDLSLGRVPPLAVH